ncbi:MAG: ABC transporter permease [Gemmatimonadota bacterium]|nr:MAG: ABC transporter permease [Gemmatimonadota bacterium]
MMAGRAGKKPPKLAERLLILTLPPEDRAAVARDLTELYQMRASRMGGLRATAWYWWQVVSFATRQLKEGGTGRDEQLIGPRSDVTAVPGGRPYREILVNSTIQDIRYAVRGLARTPGFTLVALVTLGLGIAASTSIFSVVNGILLRPLPYPDSDRLVELFRTEDDGQQRDNHSGANYLDIKRQSRSFAGLAGHRSLRYAVVLDGTPRLIRGASVTSDFFEVLGIRAAVGRSLSTAIDVPGSDRVIVISYGMWRSQYGADPSILGQTLQANEQSYAIVGVMPPGFAFPEDVLFWASSPFEVPESPVDVGDDPASVRDLSWFSVVGRLEPGATLDQAQAEMTLIAERIRREYPNVDEGTLVVPLHESIVGDVKTSLLVLLGSVGFLLLIACANVANLLLVRASGREREIAVRMAIGAGRIRILRQLVTESLVLALMGGAIGFSLALRGTRALLSLAPDGIPRVAEVGTDLRVLGFTLATAAATGILFGLAPAAQVFYFGAGRSAPLAGVRQTASRRRNRMRNALIVGEVAVSLLLLVGAGLMVRTLVTLAAVDPGFDGDNVLTARVWIPAAKYQEDDDIITFYRETLDRVNTIPGVRSAGAVLSLPVNSGINGTFTFSIEGRVPEDDADSPAAGFQVASSDYLTTIGIPLLRGRWFTDADDSQAPNVVVINQALADRYWPDEDPVGKRLTWGNAEGEDPDWATVVGIIGNTRHFGLDEPPRLEIYQPYLQGSLPYLTLVVKSETDPITLTAAVRRAVMAVDPAQPVSAAATMEQVLFDSLGSRRFNMLLLVIFAVTALVLAAVGLYGVLSYTVSQRSNEIGIRMALGARTGAVIGRVMQEGIGLTALGLGIGVAGAVGLTRLMRSMIHGISATDPASFAIGATLLLLIAGLASLVPAFKASRVDPIQVLRTE